MSKKKMFRLVDFSKEGKGVTKEQARKNEENRYSFLGFFRLFKRNFSLLAMLNMFFIITNIFIFSALIALTGNFDNTHLVPASSAFQPLFGISQYSTSAATCSLFGVSGVQGVVGYPSTTTYILYAVAALTVFTFGPTNAGMAYVLRGLVRGDYVDMSDYFRAIKKNFLSALLLGILDILVLFIFAYAVYFYYLQTVGGFVYMMMYYLSLFFLLLYVMMRFFLYQLLVTFKLSIFKIFKNSYILTVAGIKRNIVGLIACALVLGINVVLFLVLPPLGAVMPFVLTFVLLALIAIFVGYPTVKRLMIDPYYPEQESESVEEEPIFHDVG